MGGPLVSNYSKRGSSKNGSLQNLSLVCRLANLTDGLMAGALYRPLISVLTGKNLFSILAGASKSLNHYKRWTLLTLSISEFIIILVKKKKADNRSY